MKRFFIFVGVSLLVLGLAAGEYFLNKPVVYFLPLSSGSELSSFFPEHILLEKDKMFIKSSQKQVSNLFRQIGLTDNNVDFSILQTVFLKQVGDSQTPYVVVYEIFAQKEKSISIGYQEIKSAFEVMYAHSPVVFVKDDGGVGDMSFIIDLGKQEKNMYRIVAYKEYLFGFEYPKDEEEALTALFHQMFPSQ